ncbi:MAG: hypothetical protein WA162_01240 [Thermodesulfobacteriota bacterium]
MFKKYLAVAIVALFAVSACSKKEEPKAGAEPGVAPVAQGQSADQAASPHGAMPSAMPPSGNGGMVSVPHAPVKATKPLQLSKEVKAAWKVVEIKLTDASSKTSEAVNAEIGKKTALKAAGFSVKVEAFVPDYTIYEDYIGSKSNEPNNPAIMVELFEKDKSVAKGWIFNKAEFSSFNSFKHDRFSVSLVSAAGKK